MSGKDRRNLAYTKKISTKRQPEFSTDGNEGIIDTTTNNDYLNTHPNHSKDTQNSQPSHPSQPQTFNPPPPI